ncbi:hypothetical protein ACFLXW_00200 [Candidatus Dependentiae bacterium]
MKKLLSIGLLLSLCAGSAQALRYAAPGFAPRTAQKGIAQLKDTVAIDKAKVAGYKAQVRNLAKPAQTSPVVENVLARKEAKLIQQQDAVKAANQKLRANEAALKKTAKSWFN